MKLYIWHILLICPFVTAQGQAPHMTFTGTSSQECQKNVACLHINTMISDPTSYVVTLYNIQQSADALILIIDSGGGSCGASETVAREVKIAAEHMPVITFVKELCASGAYLVASASDYIISPQSAEIGSVGTFLGIEKEHIESFQRKQKDEDENNESIVSGTVSYDIIGSSEKKTALHPLSGDLSDEDRELLQAKTNELSQYFADQVAHNRDIAYNRDEWATGDIFTGQHAYELNLIDEIGSFTTAFQKIHSILQDAEPHTTVTHCILTPWLPGQ